MYQYVYKIIYDIYIYIILLISQLGPNPDADLYEITISVYTAAVVITCADDKVKDLKYRFSFSLLRRILPCLREIRQ